MVGVCYILVATRWQQQTSETDGQTSMPLFTGYGCHTRPPSQNGPTRGTSGANTPGILVASAQHALQGHKLTQQVFRHGHKTNSRS